MLEPKRVIVRPKRLFPFSLAAGQNVSAWLHSPWLTEAGDRVMRLQPSKVTLPRPAGVSFPPSRTGCFVQIRRVSGERCRATMDLDSILKVYRRYAPAYDFVFGPVFQLGRMMTATRVNELDSKSILEVGVGTGLSLARYDAQRKIVGIDVSSEMLAIAKRRVESRGLDNVTALAEMDGERLAFRDGEFDAVVAMHVMSVTPNPRQCLAEMQRVCASGGNILICNHFVKQREKSISPLLQPLSRQLGWRPNFSLPELLEDSPLEVATINPVPPFGFFDLIVLHKP